MSWDRLERELALWSATGRVAELWWRDDDAAAATPSLTRLLDLTGAAGIPVALAAVPALAEPSLAAAVAAAAHATVLQHGFAHLDHAPPGARPVECGGSRAPAVVLAELAAGRERLASLVGPRFVPALVPPWNRIDPLLLPSLAGRGFRGFSSWGPRTAPEAAPGLPQVHTHADLVAWRRDRRFAGVDHVLDELLLHLGAKREGRADAAEPTGLLTHHLVHDEEGWAFLHTMVERTAVHAGLRWVDAQSLFGTGP
jgi:hypothetical protein